MRRNARAPRQDMVLDGPLRQAQGPSSSIGQEERSGDSLASVSLSSLSASWPRSPKLFSGSELASKLAEAGGHQEIRRLPSRRTAACPAPFVGYSIWSMRLRGRRSFRSHRQADPASSAAQIDDVRPSSPLQAERGLAEGDAQCGFLDRAVRHSPPHPDGSSHPPAYRTRARPLRRVEHRKAPEWPGSESLAIFACRDRLHAMIGEPSSAFWRSTRSPFIWIERICLPPSPTILQRTQ